MQIRAFTARTASKAAFQPAVKPCFRRSTVRARAEYKFGDFTKGLMKGAKQQLDTLGKAVTGDEDYQFGDLTRKLVGTVVEQASAGSLALKELSQEAVDGLKNYKFGDITRSLLQTEWGKEVVAHAQEAGRNLTGRTDYQIGDLSREAFSRLTSAQDRAAKLLALPSEVEQLKQIVLEQQIMINSLTKKEGTQLEAKELLALTGSAEELKPLVLEQQQVIDVLLSSMDENKK